MLSWRQIGAVALCYRFHQLLQLQIVQPHLHNELDLTSHQYQQQSGPSTVERLI